MPSGNRIQSLDPNPPGGGKGKAGIAAALAVILGAVYAVEGGYVNDPNDPGGATNYGVTEKVARQAGYRGDMRLFPKHCTGPQTVCADAIYLRDYIVKPGFMQVIEADPAVGGELVDSGVNFGPARPSKWFEQALAEQGGAGFASDARIGAGEIAAYRALQARFGPVKACIATLDRLDAKQAAEYRRLAARNPNLNKFLKGWLRNRVGNIDRKTCGWGV